MQCLCSKHLVKVIVNNYEWGFFSFPFRALLAGMPSLLHTAGSGTRAAEQGGQD